MNTDLKKFLNSLKTLPLFFLPIAGLTTVILAGIFMINTDTFNIHTKNKSQTDERIEDNKKEAVVINSQNAQIEILLEIADDDNERAQGLMNRTFLAEGEGMLFIFDNEMPRTFWMKNTYISLDMIFLDSQKKIVSISRETTPLDTTMKYSSNRPAQYVIEVNGGWSDRHNVKEGDTVFF